MELVFEIQLVFSEEGRDSRFIIEPTIAALITFWCLVTLQRIEGSQFFKERTPLPLLLKG